MGCCSSCCRIPAVDDGALQMVSTAPSAAYPSIPTPEVSSSVTSPVKQVEKDVHVPEHQKYNEGDEDDVAVQPSGDALQEQPSQSKKDTDQEPEIVVHVAPLEMEQSESSVTVAVVLAPEQATAGSTIQVGLQGPRKDGNVILWRAKGDPETTISTILVPDGTMDSKECSSLDITVPSDPGSYEIQYCLSDGNVLAKSSIEVIAANVVNINVPAQQVKPGEMIDVKWEGPNNEGDFISIGYPGEPYINRTNMSQGSPLKLLVPADITGELEPVHINVVPLDVNISCLEQANAGETIDVRWQGPNGDGDFVAIVKDGDVGYTNYKYTSDGNPLKLLIPIKAGKYEIRYYSGQDQRIITSLPIQVDAVNVKLTFPEHAMVGETIEVHWEGPNYDGDFIGIGKRKKEYTNYKYTADGNPVSLLMPAKKGEYEIRYYSGQDHKILAAVPIHIDPVSIKLSAPEHALNGDTISVHWEGPNYEGDVIGIGKRKKENINFAFTADGNPLNLLMPAKKGDYEIRYCTGQDRIVLDSVPIRVDNVHVKLVAPDRAIAGQTIDVLWEGPNSDGDMIAFGAPGMEYTNFCYTSDGNPSKLVIPLVMGENEIRYYSGQNQKVLASHAIYIDAVSVNITAPKQTVAGTTIDVAWDGPGYHGDFIGIGKPGMEYTNYSYTSDGSPTKLIIPIEAGDYEIRYYAGQDQSILSCSSIRVDAANASLTFPQQVNAGETINIQWEGPGYDGDFVAIGKCGNRDYDINYTYTSNDHPLRLLIPAESGDYEIRYYAGQNQKILTSIPVRVEAVSAKLTAPMQVSAGATVDVQWEGPNNDGDFIGIGKTGQAGYTNYKLTADGNPSNLLVPVDAGDYEIRYYSGQNQKILNTIPIHVDEVSVKIAAPNQALAGETIEFRWDGPDYDGDFIAVGKMGDNGYKHYTYTSSGNPSRLLMPLEAGDFEIRYYSGQNNKILSSAPIHLDAVSVNLTAPDQAMIEETISVEWEGPDYDGDFIAIGKSGKDYLNYKYTTKGNPAKLTLPSKKGDYELRYYAGQDQEILFSVPIRVTSLSATVTHPEKAMAGEAIFVQWKGPDSDGDFIGVGKGGKSHIHRTFTLEGNPCKLLMPVKTGNYEIRYYSCSGKEPKVLASSPIRIDRVTVELRAPKSAIGGETINVYWEGPNIEDYFIGIGKRGKIYSNYRNAATGNPSKLLLPLEMGEYEIRFYAGKDQKVLASVPIRVGSVDVILMAPQRALVGETIDVRWQGPDYEGDFIGIGKVEKEYTHFNYTSDGNPSKLEMPDKPGFYEIRYYAGQDNSVLGIVTIHVEDPENA